jgi:hypothetical protein
VTEELPTPRISRSRLFTALAVLPLFDACLGYLAFPLWWALRNAPGDFSEPTPAFAFAAINGVTGLFVTVTAVLPAVFWLQKRGPLTLQRLTLAGALLGNLPFAVVAAATVAIAFGHLVGGTLSDHLSPAPDLLGGALRVILLGTFMGAASGAMFWALAVFGGREVRRRPPDFLALR